MVGSGPGGDGFLHRLVRLRPDLSVIWIEKGQDFVARNWPEEIAAVNGDVDLQQEMEQFRGSEAMLPTRVRPIF